MLHAVLRHFSSNYPALVIQTQQLTFLLKRSGPPPCTFPCQVLIDTDVSIHFPFVIKLSCFSSANDEHLLLVPMLSLTDESESCDLDGSSSGNNTPAVGQFFSLHAPLWIQAVVSEQKRLANYRFRKNIVQKTAHEADFLLLAESAACEIRTTAAT